MNHQYFTIEELLYSDTALKKRIRNKTSKAIEDSLDLLITAVLDPLRKAYGKPITVTSGYRCKELNKAVGGVSNSQHTTGCAADITAGSRSANQALARLIVSLNLPYDQCIDEKGLQWVHVSIAPPMSCARKQLLRYDGRKYTSITVNEI